jgi:hypothetical protein
MLLCKMPTLSGKMWGILMLLVVLSLSRAMFLQMELVVGIHVRVYVGPLILLKAVQMGVPVNMSMLNIRTDLLELVEFPNGPLDFNQKALKVKVWRERCAVVNLEGLFKPSPAGLSGVQVTNVVSHDLSAGGVSEEPVVLSPAKPIVLGASSVTYNAVKGLMLDSVESMPPPSLLTNSLHVWKQELAGDINESFFLQGVEYGFSIVDSVVELKDSLCRNDKSVLLDDRLKAEAQILKEVNLHRYIMVRKRPSIVSSLGGVPKKGTSKIRIIHDLSRPGGGLNQFCTDSAVSYSTVDDAVKHIKVGSYLAKIDLSEAYRSVPINPSCYDYTGLQWIFDGHS